MVQTNRRNRLFLTSHELTSQAQKKIGILIFLCALVAILAANTLPSYTKFWEGAIGFSDISRRRFVNEFLMIFFFFSAGMELKQEFFYGHFIDKKKRLLPLYCAIGGIVVPIFLMVIFGTIAHIAPFAESRIIFRSISIPIASDTVFALAVLSFVSRRGPRELRSLLLALVVIDDIAGLGFLSILEGKVLPTSIAVVLGFLLPNTIGNFRVNHYLSIYLLFIVNLFVLPVFALANAGLRLGGLSFQAVVEQPLFWALILSQFLGKIIGIYFGAKISCKFNWAKLPQKINFQHIFIMACAGGVGFTISLYLAEIALGAYPQLHIIAKVALITNTCIASLVTILFAMRLPVQIRSKEPDAI